MMGCHYDYQILPQETSPPLAEGSRFTKKV